MLRDVGRLESKAEDACATLSIDAANALPSSLSSERSGRAELRDHS